jgi:hypothetical protein
MIFLIALFGHRKSFITHNDKLHFWSIWINLRQGREIEDTVSVFFFYSGMGLFTAISLSKYTRTSTFNKNNVSHCRYTNFVQERL